MRTFFDLFADRKPTVRTVRDVLTEMGLSEEEIDQAEVAGTDEMLALDHLVLPDPGRFSMDELAAAAGLPLDLVRAVWRAMGFADVVDDQRLFTRRDADMLKRFSSALDRGLIEPDRSLQMIRVLGMSMAQF